MFALIAFRNHYIKSMVTSLRNDHGLGVVAQAVGSADATSDYDVTLAGPDDIHAFAEANEAFRNAWGKESGVVFDTNFYFLREWLTVGNNIVKDRNGTDAPGDAFNQLEMDEQTSDLYSLAKIRRYTSKAEWAALTKAVCNQVQLDGREAAQLPLFRRLGLVDDIYRTQYVMPLLTRLGDLHQRWIAALKQGGHAPKDDEDMTKRTPRTLERLIHWDRNAVLKACNLAYLEVIHLEREAEKQILAAREYQEGPQMKVKRIWRETMAKSVVQRPESGLNEAGVYQRNRLCGKLFSEAHLFAAESYNSQASMKDVVAKQGNFRSKLKFTAHEYLHCFNEQIGDALKEVREYQRMVDEYLEQEKGFAHGGEKKTKADDEPVGVGFYRASKYEVRLKEALGNLLVSLQGPKQAADDAKQLPELHPDRRIARRRELWPALFDGAKAPDEADLLLLKKEIDFADNWKDVLQPLLNIRKSEKEAAGLTAEQKRNRAREIVNGVVGSASFKRAASDPERQATKIAYEKADAKYVPKGEEWQLRHLTDYLLHHCAQVNQVVRRLLSRSEMELHADLAPDEAPQAGAVDRPQPPPEAPEKQPGPPQPRECKLVVELDASGAGKWPGRELTVRARNVDDYEQEKVQKVTMTGARATVDLSGLRAFSVSVDVLVGTANRKAGFQCWMWETVEVPADGSTVKLAARIDWEEPRPPDVQPLQLGRSGKLSAGTLEKLGQLARTCEYTVAKSYGELACWNWALTAFQSALVPKGWWPENVFGYLNDREIYGNEIDPDCRDALRAIEYESDADDRDARRLEAIDNAMSLIVAKYGLERTKEKTNYSLHMYFHKRRYDWEKDPTDKKGKRMRRKAWGGDYDGPNFQHVWLEVVDSKQRTWVIEHFPGSNLRLTRRRQDVSEGDDYGLWSANLTGLLEQHRKLIDELADRGIRINEE
jgi:hypothetical protein